MIVRVFEKLFERIGYALIYAGIGSVILLFIGLEEVSGAVKRVIKTFNIPTGGNSVDTLAIITAFLVPLNLMSMGITLSIAARYRHFRGLYEEQPENFAKMALLCMLIVILCAIMSTSLAYLAMVGIIWYVIAWLTGLSLMFVQAIQLFKVATMMERLLKGKEQKNNDGENARGYK